MADQILTTQIDKRKFDLALRLFPRQLKVHLGDAFDHISLHFLKEWKAKRLQGPPGIRGRPHGIFSQFKRVLLIPSGGDINKMGLEIFTGSKIARHHERGETVTPRGGGKLAVPLSSRPELFTSSGALKKKYRNLRSLKNIVPIRFKGQIFLARVQKKTRAVVPLFVLKRSVKLKPRLEFIKTWDSQENWRINRLNQAINKTLNEV